jgi:membrane-associated phospholipid phosphatase
MRVMPNYEVNPIHVAEPYHFEKALFGLNTAAGRLTLNEYFKIHHTPFWDILTGLFYLNWVPIPLLFAFWLMRTDKLLFLKFSYAFVFTNLVGFCIYYLYPAAPPWYVELYGFDIIHNTPGNAAGLLEFDKLLGINLFAGMYQKNANVFAAIPSLHSAYPVLCLLYGLRLKKTWLNVLFAVFTAGVWFAAVYSRHHYFIDVLLGGAVAGVSYLVFEFLSDKTYLRKWFEAFSQKI